MQVSSASISGIKRFQKTPYHKNTSMKKKERRKKTAERNVDQRHKQYHSNIHPWVTADRKPFSFLKYLECRYVPRSALARLWPCWPWITQKITTEHIAPRQISCGTYHLDLIGFRCRCCYICIMYMYIFMYSFFLLAFSYVGLEPFEQQICI